MASLPIIGTVDPGIYQAITNTTDTNAIPIPDGAVGCVLYFTANGDVIEGRVGVGTSSTSLTAISNTKLGWHAPVPIHQEASRYTIPVDAQVERYLHVACPTTGAVCKGYWLFSSN